MAHIVTGPLAIVKDSNGQPHYYYEGATLPDGIADDELDRLTDSGLVTEVDDPLAPIVIDEPATVADTTPAPGVPESERPGELTTRPPLVAQKPAWVDYAVSRGMDRDKADAMTKGELIDAYPPES